MAPGDSHRVVTTTSFLANTACPSRQQNWDNGRGMDSDINWGSRLKTQLVCWQEHPATVSSSCHAHVLRVTTGNETQRRRKICPQLRPMVAKCFVWTTLWLVEIELQASWKTAYHPVRVFADHPQGSFVFGMQWKVSLRKEGSINWEIQAMAEECGWICSASRLPFHSVTGRKRDATPRKRKHENCCQRKEFLLPSHADWGLHLQMVINIDYGLSCVDAYRPEVSVSLRGLWASFLMPFSYTLMFQSCFLL